QSQWTRLFGRIFVAAIVLILLLIATGAASYIRHRCLIPLTSLFPLYLAAKIEASGETLSIAGGRRFAGAVLAIMVAVPLLLFARPYVNGMTGDYGKRNVPYGEAVEVILQSRKEHPAVILVTDHQIAGN